MNKEVQLDIYNFGASFILDQVSQLEGEIDGALTGEDIEYVHRMRVASRRLRNALKRFNEYFPDNFARKWHSEMKEITRSLGNARDLDIQIQLVKEKYQETIYEKYKPGYECLLVRLKQLRSIAQDEVIEAVHHLNEKLILKEIRLVLNNVQAGQKRHFTPALYAFAQKAIRDSLDTFLNFRDSIQAPDNSKKLHEMRIAGKHLRYTMEIFEPLYENDLSPFIEIMKEIQDQLGEIHDCDVWITWLPEFIQQEKKRIRVSFGDTQSISGLLPGLLHLIEDRKHKRQVEYEVFVSNWQRLISEQTWKALRKTIQYSESQ